MALPKSLTQPLRQGQLTVGSGWRAYFAPFNMALAVAQTSTVLGPTIYDLQISGKFTEPKAGWFDLGFVKNFRFTPGSKTGNVVSGYRGAIRAKYRAEVAEKMTITFGEMSRMAMKIATGTQVFNLLYNTGSPSTAGPLSASGVAAQALHASGYSATGFTGATSGLPTLLVPAGTGANYQVNQFIVCDDDYNGSDFGFVGDAGANVFQGAVTDTDFIRKTSDYVARIIQIVPTAIAGADGLVLSGPLVGGGNSSSVTSGLGDVGPTAAAKIQRIVGFASREGGTYITEWSGIFLLDTVDQSQMLFYYPRIAPDVMPGLEVANLQNATSLQTYDMNASFDALAFDDPLDGETVVRYSAYYPNKSVSPQI